jgi:hypothetical protein
LTVFIKPQDLIDKKYLLKYALNDFHKYTIFGTPEEMENLPTSHKDQIVIFNEEGQKLISEFLGVCKIFEDYVQVRNFGNNWKYFKTTEKYFNNNDVKSLKKWLYNKQIKFDKEVIIIDFDGNSAIATWKMVIKYSDKLFFGNNIAICDQTLNWGIINHHNGQFYFGQDNIYDNSVQEKLMLELIEIKKLYPFLQTPF